jgi:hypothetical protein
MDGLRGLVAKTAKESSSAKNMHCPVNGMYSRRFDSCPLPLYAVEFKKGIRGFFYINYQVLK